MQSTIVYILFTISPSIPLQSAARCDRIIARLDRSARKSEEHASIVKCERVKTIAYRFYDVRQPKARSVPSRRLAKATARDYATVAEYNNPPPEGESIQKDILKPHENIAKHYFIFVCPKSKIRFCTPFADPSGNHKKSQLNNTPA